MNAQKDHTLLNILDRALERDPETLGYTFLQDAHTDAAFLSYPELARKARAVGALLGQHTQPGDRVLLLYPPGLDFLVGFFGCLAGGCTAVPVYPPDPMRLDRTLPRLQLIAHDAQATVALTTEMVSGMVQMVQGQAPALAALRWLTTDTLADGLEEDWSAPDLGADALAFLQYTSGSTSAPKGVMVTHGNLMANLSLMHRCFDNGPDSHAVNWLPMYHDMGLIGAALQPIYAAHPGSFLSPLTFLSQPASWLGAISRLRGTHCGGPDFGYHLCARRISDDILDTLDLSCWRLAFNGAEPVRAETMARFSERFARCGFDPGAFFPCYGLAEATLFVTGGPIGRGAVRHDLDADALEHDFPTPAKDGAVSRSAVGCGLLHEGAEVRVDALEGHIGELLVKGPSVAVGYWNKPEASREAFGEDGWLKTGDLGFVTDGTLVVMGRSKDLIILRGRNHYPQDIERTAEASHALLRTGCAAAFSIESNGEERLVVAIEARDGAEARAAEVTAAIRRRIALEHGVELFAAVLIKTRAIPKTSSGKIQRGACRRGFLAGTLETLGESRFGGRDKAALPDRMALGELEVERRVDVLAEAIGGWLSAALGVVGVGLETPIARLGLDSLQAAELGCALEDAQGVEVAMARILGGASAAGLAREVVGAADASTPTATKLGAVQRGASWPLTWQQARSWHFDRALEAGTFRFHVSGAYALEGPWDGGAFASSWRALVERHEALRTHFKVDTDGQPCQWADEGRAMVPEFVDLRALDEESQRKDVRRRAQAQAEAAFDLEVDPMARIAVLRTGDARAVVLLTVHHIVADAASMAILIEELATLYDAALSGTQTTLPPVAAQLGDFAVWQRQTLASRLPDDLAHWRTRMAGHVEALQLDVEGLETSSGHAVWTADTGLSDGLRALSKRLGTTLFTTLFSAYQAALLGWSGAEDQLVDSVFSNRARPELARTVGFVAENLVTRADLSGDPTFEALAHRVHGVVLEAYDRRSWRSLFYTDPVLKDVALSPICFNMQPPTFEVRIERRSVALTPLAQMTRELMVHCLGAIVYVFEQNGALHFDLVYNRALFGDGWAESFLGTIGSVLRGALDDPSRKLSELLP